MRHLGSDFVRNAANFLWRLYGIAGRLNFDKLCFRQHILITEGLEKVLDHTQEQAMHRIVDVISYRVKVL